MIEKLSGRFSGVGAWSSLMFILEIFNPNELANRQRIFAG